nr:hepatoma-derived growth factor-related protein 2-like [Malus domestica]
MSKRKNCLRKKKCLISRREKYEMEEEEDEERRKRDDKARSEKASYSRRVIQAVAVEISKPRRSANNEENSSDPIPLVRCPRPAEQTNEVLLPLDKGKGVISSTPNPDRDIQLPVEATSHANLEVAAERPAVEPVTSTGEEATTETLVHHQDKSQHPRTRHHLSLSRQNKGLDFVGKCLNNLAADGLVSNESIVHLTTVLERTQLYFDIFEKALQVNEDLKVATTAQEAILPELKAMKTKKEKMADLDRQFAELQSQRVSIAFESKRDFEANKPRLAEYAVGVK